MDYPINTIKTEIITLLEQTLSKLNYKIKINLEMPPEDMGDFAFPCFSLAPIAKKSPNEISKDICKKIPKSDWIDKIESKGGYVNFFLNNKMLIENTLKSIFKNREKYGYLSSKKERVLVEHTSANPNGPLHVGRARNPIIGDTIVRIYKAAGYSVESQFYLDDMGKQVAILAWGVKNIEPKDIPKSDYDKPDHKTVGFYQVASKRMEEDEKIYEQIGEIVKKLEEGDKKTIDMIHEAYRPVLDGIIQSLKRINIDIDRYIPESNFVRDKSVEFVVEKLKKSDICGIEQGAYFLDLKRYGIKGRNTKFVFLRNDGTTLYATRDIAYHLWKAKNADILINILGEDHKLESKQVEIALDLVGAKTVPKPIFYAFVSLPGGKMSTRRGRVVFIDDLVDECVQRALEEVKKRRGHELSEKKMIEISEIVGIGALRYNIIKVQPEKEIVFKWDEALNFEGNAAPFIQYSHARACSIFEKKNDDITDVDSSVLKHNSEIELIKKLAFLPNVIEDACKGNKPHILTTFVFEVASKFNQFYRDCPVIHEENKKLRIARLELVDATRITIKNCLDLLGIVAPAEM